MKNKWGLPLLLGIATFALLFFVLQGSGTATQDVVVAARDLGAGAMLTPADLEVRTVPSDQLPADVLTDPATLVGQTLAVVRYAGEPVTLRHIGPAVQLAPHERAIGVRVRADTAVGRLLVPGSTVGVIATLEVRTDDGEAMQAKMLFEGLRVLYVPPDFQAQPYQPTAASPSDEAEDDMLMSSSSTPAPTSDEGVIVLAASTRPQAIYYETAASLAGRAELAGDLLAEAPAIEAETTYQIPVEVLAALNAQGEDALTLVLVPENAEPYTTSGIAAPLLLGPLPALTTTQPQAAQ